MKQISICKTFKINKNIKNCKECPLLIEHPREPECGHPYFDNIEDVWARCNATHPDKLTNRCPLVKEGYLIETKEEKDPNLIRIHSHNINGKLAFYYEYPDGKLTQIFKNKEGTYEKSINDLSELTID